MATLTDLDVTAEVKNYIVCGDDIILPSSSTTVPTWMQDYLNSALSGNDIVKNLSDLIMMLQNIATGYSTKMYEIQTDNTSMYAQMEALKAQLSDAQAAIVQLDTVKVTSEYATAIAETVVGAFFDTDAGAWFDQKISTYASNIAANASNISTLVAVLGDTSVRLDSIDQVLVTLDGWSASASKLITAPDGSITGWSFADGSNVSSEFNIYADTFKVTNGTNTYSPFTVDGTGVYFNGPITVNQTPSSVFLGDYASHPSNPVMIGLMSYTYKIGDTYHNTSDGVVYAYTSTGWVSTQGANGQGQVKGICFLRSSSQPATPTGGTYLSPTATGWSDGIPSGTLPLYMTTRIFTSDGLSPQQSTWTTPSLTSSLGQGIKVQFSVDNVSWHDTPTTSDVYMRNCTSIDNGATWTCNGSVKIKGENGLNGLNGTRGAISAFSTTVYSSHPTASTLASVIYQITDPDSCIVGDNVTYVVSGSSGGTFKAYCTAAGSPGTWVNNVALYINGNAIISGSVTAAALNADAISTCKLYVSDSNAVAYSTFRAYATTAASTVAFGGVYTGSSSGVGVYGAANNTTSSSAMGIQGSCTYGMGVAGYSTSGVGTFGRSGEHAVKGETTNANGYWGLITYQKCYAQGGFSSPVTTISFTGGHTCFGNDPLMTIGDIVTVESGTLITVDQSYTIVKLPSVDKDKKVFGVISKISDDVELNLREYTELLNKVVKMELREIPQEDGSILETEEEVISYEGYKDEYIGYINSLKDNGYKDIVANAIGEGGINVCEINGNIENGDYICSSSVRGKGMKQDDDIMHSYTVAKALESVDWSTEIPGIGTCFEQDGYKCKMIACTYHCG